ncbi:hypothetical protein ACDY96_00030 [Rhizobium mongolense]|uniref:hypothetical protein n=1 Tax=Rhizobium mongolense TaxID=57676 RepID=UPI003559095A
MRGVGPRHADQVRQTLNSRQHFIKDRAGRTGMNGDTMHVEIEKPKINPVHFIAICGGIAINSFALSGDVWVSHGNTIDDIQRKQIELGYRVDDQQKTLQGAFDGMNSKIGQIVPLQFQQSRMIEQITENKTGIVEANKRMDRFGELVSGKLDTLVDRVGKISTQVKVLGSKIDANGKSDRTIFKTPIVRP